MKSYYCKRLYEDINFDVERAYVCCGAQLGPAFSINIKEVTDLEKYCEELTKWKYNEAKNACLGELAPECQDCLELVTKKINILSYIKTRFLPSKFSIKNFQIKNIVVKSYRQCELSCLYCMERPFTKGKKTTKICKSEFYDLVPFIKALEKQNLLDKKDLKVEFQGGSISVWDEFIPILNEVVNFGVKHLMYHTNAITFIPEIVENAKNIDSSMSIAIDSGCKETYKLIKGEDKFDDVVENIVKYANANICCSVKYIISKNLNDNTEEVFKFLKVIKEMKEKIKNKKNIKPMIDIDFRESLTDKDYKIPQNYSRMINFAIRYGQKHRFDIGLQPFIRKIL